MSLTLNNSLIDNYLAWINRNSRLLLSERNIRETPIITDDEIKELYLNGKATLDDVKYHINDSKSIEMLVWLVENIGSQLYFPAYGIWQYRGFKNFYQQTYNIVIGNMKVSTSHIDIKYIIGTYIKRTPKNSTENIFKKELQKLGYECVNSEIETNWENTLSAKIILNMWHNIKID